MSAVCENIQKYYSSLETSGDLQTNAACVQSDPVTRSVREALKEIHPDVCRRFLGCGLVVPEKLNGCKVLDLGSGSGRDCFVLSKLVGENGQVTGLDMTDQMICASQKYVQHHQEKFGYSRPNTVFVKGHMENLGEAGIQNDSLDVVVSNCAICLCPDKRRVLSEAYRVLKEGGEMYYSDMYASQILPHILQEDLVMWGEGIAGALYWRDLTTLMKSVGFSSPHLVAARHITIQNPDLRRKTGEIKYASGTYRIFKLPPHSVGKKSLVTYKGTIPDCTDSFEFDSSLSFKRNMPVKLDSETAAILLNTRFCEDFVVSELDEPDTQSSQQLSPFELADRLSESVRKTL